MNCTQEHKKIQITNISKSYTLYTCTCTANDGKLGKQVHVQMELALNIMNINVKVRIQNKD